MQSRKRFKGHCGRAVICPGGLGSCSSSRETRSFPWCDLLHGSRQGDVLTTGPWHRVLMLKEDPLPAPPSFPQHAWDKGSLWGPVRRPHPHSPAAEDQATWKAPPRSKATHGKELTFQGQRENSSRSSLHHAAPLTLSLPHPFSGFFTPSLA